MSNVVELFGPRVRKKEIHINEDIVSYNRPYTIYDVAMGAMIAQYVYQDDGASALLWTLVHDMSESGKFRLNPDREALEFRGPLKRYACILSTRGSEGMTALMEKLYTSDGD